MKILVDDVPAEGKRLRGAVDVALVTEGDADHLAVPGPVGYDLWVTRLGSTVSLEGSLTARVEAGCSRCARMLEIPVDRAFQAVFVTADTGETDQAVELDEDDLDLDYYRGGVIDGQELLAEQILLEVPMKILCADDCKGLCPTCGANLNQTECDCDPPADPRWAALKDLRDRI